MPQSHCPQRDKTVGTLGAHQHHLSCSPTPRAFCQGPKAPAAMLPSPQHAAQRPSLAAGSSDRTPQLCLRSLGTWECILPLFPSACLPSRGLLEILPRFQGFLLRTWAAGAGRNDVPINKANKNLAATHLSTTKTCWFLKKLMILSILKKHLPHAGT